MIYITNCRKGSEIWCGWAGWSCLDKQSWQKMRVVDMCIRQREEPIQKLSLSGKHRTFCELHTRFLVGESVKWRGACWRWVQGWGGPSTAPHGEDMRRWHNRLIILKRLSCLFFPLEKKKMWFEKSFLPTEFRGQRSLAGYTANGVAKSWTQLSDWHLNSKERA